MLAFCQMQQRADRRADQRGAQQQAVVETVGDKAHDDAPDGEARPVGADPEARLGDAARGQQRGGKLPGAGDHAAGEEEDRHAEHHRRDAQRLEQADALDDFAGVGLLSGHDPLRAGEEKQQQDQREEHEDQQIADMPRLPQALDDQRGERRTDGLPQPIGGVQPVELPAGVADGDEVIQPGVEGAEAERGHECRRDQRDPRRRDDVADHAAAP